MTSLSRAAWFTFALWLAPLAAVAQEAATERGTGEAQEVLWLVEADLSDEDLAALEAALESSLDVSLVTTSEIGMRLRRLAESLGEDPAVRGADQALEQARRAYVELRLGEARSSYVQALEAVLGSARGPADPTSVATVFFERALIELAAQRRTEAISLLGIALTIDPAFAPDPEIYGPPLFRALAAARRHPRRPRSLELERAPRDALVRVDGRVAPSETVEVAGEGPHLVTAARRGHQARSLLVEVPSGGGSAAIVLRPAEDALLASQLLEIWDGEWPLDEEAGPLLAAASGIVNIAVVRRQGEGLLLTTSRLADGEMLRQASGSRVEWERRPYFVLAEALAGRSVEPPPSGFGPRPVSLAVSAPASVVTGSPFVLNLTVDDPGRRVRAIRARCGESTDEVRFENTPPSSIELTASEEAGAVDCEVIAFAGDGEVLVRFPDGEARLSVQIQRRSRGRGWVWWVSGSAVVVAAAAVVAAVLATRPREQVLVLDGLD